MGANTRYKDSVFSFLFSNPDTLRELYGAIAGIELPPDAVVTINTLEDVLYKSRILRGFFETHGTEVVNMLMTEWKLEEALVVEREKGRTENIKNLLDFGMSPERISRALKLPLDVVKRCLN